MGLVDDGSSRQRNDGIQALRAVACLLVLVQHVTFYTCTGRGVDYLPYLKMEFGSMGVHIFFVISGFVIALSMRHGKKFILYRLARIFPAYWVVVLLGFLASCLTTTNWQFTFSSFLLLPGFPLNNSYHVPYWTLVYEMVFYGLLYGCILAGLSPKQVLQAVFVWVGAIVVYRVYHPNPIPIYDPGWLIVLSPVNICFAVGVLLALSDSEFLERIPTSFLTALFLLSWSWSQTMSADAVPVVYFALRGISYGLLLTVFRRMRVGPMLRRLGDASYGIYLLHVPVILGTLLVLKNWSAWQPLPAVWVVVMIAVLASGLLFGLVETEMYRRLVRKIGF